MEHGMLSPEKARKAFEKKQKKQKQLRTGTPIKSPPPSKPESTKKQQQASKNVEVKTKKRTTNECINNDEFVRINKMR